MLVDSFKQVSAKYAATNYNVPALVHPNTVVTNFGKVLRAIDTSYCDFGSRSELGNTIGDTAVKTVLKINSPGTSRRVRS